MPNRQIPESWDDGQHISVTLEISLLVLLCNTTMPQYNVPQYKVPQSDADYNSSLVP